LSRKFTHKSYKEISHYWKLMLMNEKTFMAASIIIIILVPSLAVGYYWINKNNQNPEFVPRLPTHTSSPAPNPIPSQANFYLEDTRLFIISANASYSNYPFPTATYNPHGYKGGEIIAQNGEPCVIINITLRNDYSAEFPLQSVWKGNSTIVWFSLGAKLYSGIQQISARDITNAQGTQAGFGALVEHFVYGENTTFTLFLATTSRNVTSFQIFDSWVGDVPPA
jgi:hypothetical protein